MSPSVGNGQWLIPPAFTLRFSRIVSQHQRSHSTGYVVSARRGDEQNRWLMWSAIGGVVVGMMLWAVFAGIVARAVPASWQWPEKMAARSLDLPMWEGGQHLMRASAPDAFANIAAGDRIVTANRQALEACRKRADKAREAVRCTIKIEPEARR
jgi:hypothetical protein